MRPHPCGTVDDLVLAVLVAFVEDGRATVLLLDPQHLAGDDVQGLVPADAHELALTAILDVALAVGIEIHPLHRVADAGRGVHALLVADTERGKRELHLRLEGLAAGLHDPGFDLFLGVLPVVVQRADADDLAVLHVHAGRAGTVDDPAPADVLHIGPFAVRTLGPARSSSIVVCHNCHQSPFPLSRWSIYRRDLGWFVLANLGGPTVG